MYNDEEEVYVGYGPSDEPYDSNTSDLPIGSTTEGTDLSTDFLGLSIHSRNNDKDEKK